MGNWFSSAENNTTNKSTTNVTVKKEQVKDEPDAVFHDIKTDYLLNDKETEFVDLNLYAFDDLVVRVRRMEEGIWLICTDGYIYFLHIELRKWFVAEEVAGNMHGRLLNNSDKEVFQALLVAVCRVIDLKAKEHNTYLELFNQWQLRSTISLQQLLEKHKQNVAESEQTPENATTYQR